MNFDLEKSIEILERTPIVYTVLFNNSKYNWDKINEGPDTWSGYNIIGHLIHGEKTDWTPRAKIILGTSVEKTFEHYDRFAQENLYSHQTTEELLVAFQDIRKKNIEELKSWKLSESDLAKEGIHPDLGIVTLKQLLSTWTIHDIVHINQVTRVMVKHYSDDVGPWKAYIKLLNH